MPNIESKLFCIFNINHSLFYKQIMQRKENKSIKENMIKLKKFSPLLKAEKKTCLIVKFVNNNNNNNKIDKNNVNYKWQMKE